MSHVLIIIQSRSLNEGALVNSGRSSPSEVTRMNSLPPPQQLMNEHYKMELISSDEYRLPLSVRSPNLHASLAPLVVQELPMRIANHGKPRTEDREEWGIILSEGKTIIDNAMISVYLETAFVTFILSSINEISFIFWTGIQLILLATINGSIGFNIRSVFYKKLPITLTFFLYILTHVISPKENESALPQRLGLMLCRLFGSYYLFRIY